MADNKYILATEEYVRRIAEDAEEPVDPNSYVRITVGDLVKGFAQAIQTGANNPQYKDRSLAANAATNGCIALVDDGNVIFDSKVEQLESHIKSLSDSLAEASGVNEVAYNAGEQAVSKRKDQEIKVYAEALQRLADGKVKRPTGCLCCNWNGDAGEMKSGDLCPCCNSALGVNVADYAAAVLNAGYDASL